MRNSRVWAGCVIVAASLVAAACGSSSSPTKTTGTAATTATSAVTVASGTINGSGSTLAAPIYQQWGSTLKGKGLTVNYNPVGSGAGVSQIQSTTVDFAGSDPALTSTDQSKAKGTLLQFPVAFGAITLSYNLPGVKSGLKLDGPTIAEIFLGKITTWNNSAITSLNPGLKLPSTSITVVHRSDSSGTTDGFTTYLSDVYPTWKTQVGSGKDVKWPTGTGAAKNSGVAAAVKQTQGAIGYVEQAYALENNFTYAAVKNSAGTYVLPTISNTSAAAEGIPVSANLEIHTINSSNPQAYTIVTPTYLVAYEDQCKAGISQSTAKAVKSWLGYAVGAGQTTLGSGSNQLPYAPLPSSLQGQDTTQLNKLVCNGASLAS